jgi:hypothetical protein
MLVRDRRKDEKAMRDHSVIRCHTYITLPLHCFVLCVTRRRKEERPCNTRRSRKRAARLDKAVGWKIRVLKGLFQRILFSHNCSGRTSLRKKKNPISKNRHSKLRHFNPNLGINGKTCLVYPVFLHEILLFKRYIRQYGWTLFSCCGECTRSE